MQCLDLLLIRVETHTLVDDLIASFAPDIERSLKTNDISALREKLTIDLCATIAPSLASKAVQVALVAELRVVPEFRRVIAVRSLSFGHGLCQGVKVMLLRFVGSKKSFFSFNEDHQSI